MLQQEFEQLTGMEVTTEIYNNLIDPMYMSTKMDKQDFCKDFKKNHLKDSAVVVNLTETCCDQHRTINKLEQERKDIVLLLLKAAGTEDNELSRKAIKMVGHKEVIRLKIMNGWELNDSDKAHLMMILNN